MINDVKLWKYIDDIIISEPMVKKQPSRIQAALDDICDKTKADKFQHNEIKCKELRIDFSKAPSTRIRIFLNPQLFLSGYENIRVHTLCDYSVFISNSPVHTYSDSLRIH